MATTEAEYLLRSIDASWSYEKWLRLPDDGNRYEVIDGVLYMSTAPGFAHQRCALWLDRRVGYPLEEAGVVIAVASPIGVVMPGVDPVQPDFLLIRRERAGIISEDGRIRGVPDLIAEVLSPNNPELDTVVKRRAYALAGVPEYWILRPETRDILVCCTPESGLADYTDVQRFATDDELISPTLPIRVSVGSLFSE